MNTHGTALRRDRRAEASDAGDTDAVEPLIARVVSAEREAREAVAQCEAQATQIAAAAQSAAEQLAQRADRRIVRLQQRMAAATQARLAAIAAQQSAVADDASADATLLARIDTAVATIADELVGPAA